MERSISPKINLDAILAKGLGLRQHWFREEVPIRELAAMLVGMANAQGGIFFLGIDPDSQSVSGVQRTEVAIDRVFQAALSVDPPLVLPVPQVESVDGIPIVRGAVPEGLPQVYSLDGRYLIRRGAETRPIPGRDLRTLLMARGLAPFESRVPEDATLDDLDPDQAAEYAAALQIAAGESTESLLIRRGCLKAVDGSARPTHAGLLLLGRHPQQWLPSATILAARFPGQAFSDEFIKQEIRGPLPDQLRQAEAFVRDNLRFVARLVGLTRQETPEYPLEAARELLVNAVAHRDYNQQGDCIHLHIFADRLEVHSPGGLPGPVNLGNLLEARFSRNAVIAQVLSDLGFVERLGYGLKRVVRVMRQANLPEPQFEEVGGSFRARLRNDPSAMVSQASLPDLSAYARYDLNSRQETALSHLAGRGRITNRAYQDLCPEVSAETLRRDLADLVKKRILIRVGDKKSTYYILKK